MKTLLVTLFILTALQTHAADLCADQETFAAAKWSEEAFKDFQKDEQKIDQILVSKKQRRLYLLQNQKVHKSYAVAFGGIEGPKQFEGDKKTPEGTYFIEAKNPWSAFYLSLKVSYPNEQDIAFAKKFDKSAGSDIMIHGFPKEPNNTGLSAEKHPEDWTAGCIAVTNPEIFEIYSVVPEKTPITICPL